jgi:hypothetical protein
VIAPPQRIIADESEVLPALRELLSQHPSMKRNGTETLTKALFVLRYLSYCPDTLAIEAAREALIVEGEVLV